MIRKILPILLLCTFPLFAKIIYAANTATGSSSKILNKAPSIPTDSGNIVVPLQVQPQPPISFLGQDHYYSVNFRGNGEAVVLLKVIVSNTLTLPLSKIDLQLSNTALKDVIVYQVLREPRCIRYSEPPLMVPQGSGSGGQIQNDLYPNPMPIRSPGLCIVYQPADYFTYLFGNTSYEKADYEIKGNTLTVSLPEEIVPNASGSFIIYFRTFSYTQKDIFGAFKYNFESLKAEDKIRNLQVGINTDSNLILKEAKGAVNYKFSEGVSALNSPNIGTTGPVQNSSFDSLYQNIGQGSIVKTVSDLAPLESFTVKGSYADSNVKLYGEEIGFTAIGIVIFIMLTLVFVRFLIARSVKVESKQKNAVKYDKVLAIVGLFGLSFMSSILILGYTLIVFFVVNFVLNAGYDANSIFLIIFLSTFSVLVYGFLLIGPPLYMGIKKGVRWALAHLFVTLMLLFVYATVAFFVIFISSQGRGEIFPSPPNIVPMMGGQAQPQ